MPAPYVPLRIFSCYTMLEGAIEPKAIAKRAKQLDFPAAALTDRNGLYAAMSFTDACAGEGVQPIIGTMLALSRPGSGPGGARPAGSENKPPLLDWLTLRALGDESDRYGAIRLWGSFAFLLTAWVFGGMLKEHPDLPVLIGAGLLTLFVPIVLLLPEPPLETQSKRKRQGGNRSIVAHGVMWPLLIVAFLLLL